MPLDPALFRRRRNRWLGELAVAAGPMLRLAAGAAARRPPSAPTAWRRGIIIGHSHIGDVLYRTCSLARLRELLPETRWSYLCAPGAAEVLAGNPSLAEVLPYVRGESSWSLAPGAFRELRRRDFDVALCTNVVRPHPDFALAAALGVPNRVGYAGKGFGALLTRPVPLAVPDSYAAYVRGIVADVGGVPADWPLRPQVHPSAADRASAEAAWADLPRDPRLPVVACAVTTRQPSGEPPRAHLLAALREARARLPFEVVLVGAASDAELLRSAADRLGGGVHVLAGTLGLRAVATFLERCDLLVTLDSGPRHLANAVGTPVLFFRSLGDTAAQTGAYVPTETDLAPPVEHLSADEIAAVVAGLPVAPTADAIVRSLRARASAPGGPPSAGR